MPRIFQSLLLFLACLGLFGNANGAEPEAAHNHDIVIVSGTVTDVHGRGLKEAQLRFFVNGESVKAAGEVLTEAGGNYEIELQFPAGTLNVARLEARVDRQAYRPSGPVELSHLVAEHDDGDGNHHRMATGSWMATGSGLVF
jgi:hypothetical protein